MTPTGKISLETEVLASTDQVSCDLAGEAVILRLKDGIYYGLNQVGARVWELVSEPRSVREIRDVLLTEYQIDELSCTRDLMELLQQLHEWNLVEIRNGNGTRPRTG